MKPGEALAGVYAARDAGELGEAYAAWADGYDRETLALGYCLPFAVTAWVARHVPRDAGPILDAGCGTGLSGPLLAALGYDHVEGMDMAEKMLARAAARKTYRLLARAVLGETLPWPDGYFTAAFSAGVFTEGHAPAESFREIARIVRPGGHVIATVRTSILRTKGFAALFREMEAEGRWRRIERSPPFRAFALAEPDVLVQAFAFEVLEAEGGM